MSARLVFSLVRIPLVILAGCATPSTTADGLVSASSGKFDELFINAPDRLSSSVRVTFNRDTGQAILSLEATDAASGTVLARIVHRPIVREVSRFNLADDTTNRFWLETAFRRWAAN